jgi:decaprenyl-phosphate phosphoribosyltransferase
MALVFMPFIHLLRPTQWLKNLMLFFPPFLGGALLVPGIWERGLVPFTAFCCASSSVYLFNDIIDIPLDRAHPVKRLRPLPSGAVTVPAAGGLSCLLLAVAAFLGSRVSTPFLLLLLVYLAVSWSYTLWFKHLPLFDIFCIASGFLFRLLAGGVAFGIEVSEWLFLSVFLLAIFLSTGKRLGEKGCLGRQAGVHRKALDTYPDGFLDGTMYMTGGAVLVTYTLYVIAHHRLIFTVPLCCFGLLRYILRVKSGREGDPTASLLKDPILFLVGIAWAAATAWGLYGG